NQLKNELKFADSSNPYINFQNLGNGNISIDPTYGLDDDGTSSTGSCRAACTKISVSSNYAGACCSCGGCWASPPCATGPSEDCFSGLSVNQRLRPPTTTAAPEQTSETSSRVLAL